MPFKLDTATHVYFYEQEFYVLSNFAAFRLRWQGLDFDTSEHAYHWEKFNYAAPGMALLRSWIRLARSAHDALKLAEAERSHVREGWEDLKVELMREILRAKVSQHPYVHRKLLETGERTLVENSWRDSWWGWGPDRQGKNMLGKLWMEIRQELREKGLY